MHPYTSACHSAKKHWALVRGVVQPITRPTLRLPELAAPPGPAFAAYSVNILDIDWSPGPQAALVMVTITNNLAKPLQLSLNRVQCR